MRYRRIVGLILSLIVVNVSLISQEKSNSSDYSWDRFSIKLGGFLTSINSDISLTSQQIGLGLVIDLEDALGLRTSNIVVRGEMDYVFGSRRRSSVTMGYFGIFRSASRVLESDLEIGNNVIAVGTQITSNFDMQIFKGIYEYSFYMDDRIKLGLSIGLYVLPSNFSIHTLYAIQESANFVAPLPVLGFSSVFLVTPKILLKQSIEILYLEISNFKGNISDINILLEYTPFRHFGIGLGYNVFRFNVSAYSEVGFINDFEGSMKTGFDGLLMYAKYYF